jgi:hypothetical protein
MSLESISKVKTYIGFAIKANKAVFGVDNLERVKRPPSLIIIGDAAGRDTQKRAEAYAQKNSVTLLLVKDIGEICPKQGVKLIGIKEVNLARAILTHTEVFYVRN